MNVIFLNKKYIKGGVGNYYYILRNYVEGAYFMDVSYSTGKYGVVDFIIKYIKYFISYFANIIKPVYKIVIFNPSLSESAFFRDYPYLLLAILFRKKRIVYFRGWHSNTEKWIDDSSLMKYIFKLLYNRANAFIVLSERFKNKLREWGFQQAIYLETTLVDDVMINGFQPNTRTKMPMSINILFLARVEEEKGIFEVLDTYQIIKKKYPELKLTIAGDGGKIDDVKYIIDEQNIENVEFTGYVTGEEKARTFVNNDLYLFPSHGEGMPNSVLEAMSFGLPVITRNVGGLRDFFEHGKMGFITESKDPEVFAEYIEKLILNPDLRNEMSRYNAEFARKHFMASVVAKRLERIYTDVLNGEVVERSWMDAVDNKL